MFNEHLKTKVNELARVQNLSEFGLNLDECNILFSTDQKYGILYTESYVAIVDLNKKKLISKSSNDKNSKISKLKITHRNNIIYLNKSLENTNLVISSIEFLGEYYQWRVPDDIQEFLYIETIDQDNEDYIFLISNKGDLHFYKQSEPQKTMNIIKDSEYKIKSGFEVINMEFIEETKNLIIILANGTIFNYTISSDPESETMNLHSIYFEEIKHLDNYEYEHDKNVISRLNNNYSITAFKITKFLFDLNDFIMNDDAKIEEQNNTRQCIFIVIGFTKNKTDTYTSFYEIQSSQLVFLNRIEFKQRFILDSYIYQTKNSYLSNRVPEYFILCLGDFDKKIEVLASDFLECLKQKRDRNIYGLNMENELFNVSSSGKDQKGSDIFTLINIFENNCIKKLAIMGVYITHNSDFILTSENQKHQKSKMEDDRNDQKSVSVISNINDYRYLEFSVNLIIRSVIVFSQFDVFLTDSDIRQVAYTPRKKYVIEKNDETKNDEELRKYAFTSDVNQHLAFFKRYNNNNEHMYHCFNRKVISLITEEPNYNELADLIENSKKEASKIDYYLLLLLFNNELLAIKYYLSLKENLIHRQFLVPNDKLFFTVKTIFYEFLKNLIYRQLQSSSVDYNFFTSDILLSNLETILESIKISKSRNDNPYDRPYDPEKIQITEDSIKFQALLFELENIILIIKIIRSYIFGVVKNESEDMMFKINEKLNSKIKERFKIREAKSNNKTNFLYFDLILMMNHDDIYPNWKRLFCHFFNNLFNEEYHNLFVVENRNNTEDILTKNFAFDDVLYFTKFQFLFYYVYLILDYNFLSKDFDDSRIKYYPLDINNLRPYFSEMEEEFNEYINIICNFYKLDFNLGITSNSYRLRDSINEENYYFDNSKFNFQSIIDISTISYFLINFNKSNLTKTRYYREIINNVNINFNSLLICLLKMDNYSKEALALSKNIVTLISGIEDFYTQLSLLLEMGLINLAFQFVNNCFAYLVCYSEDLENETNMRNRNLLETILNSEDFQHMKKLYFFFYEFLIRNNHIALLFTLPLNFIERYLLKELFMLKKEYEDLLILYFIKLRKIKEAEDCFSHYQKNAFYSKESKELYRNLIDTMKFILGDNFERLFSNFENCSLISNKNEEKLCYEIDITREKEVYSDIRKNSELINFILPKNSDLAMDMVYDSIMDIDNFPFKPSNLSINDTIKSLLSKKQETARKTFGFPTELKSGRERFESELSINEKLNENIKMIGVSSSVKNKPISTPIKRDSQIRGPIIFTSNITLKNASNEKNRTSFDFFSDSAKK